MSEQKIDDEWSVVITNQFAAAAAAADAVNDDDDDDDDGGDDGGLGIVLYLAVTRCSRILTWIFTCSSVLAMYPVTTVVTNSSTTGWSVHAALLSLPLYS